MCGIAGLLHLDPARPADPGLLTAMGHVLSHRGPDAEGTFRDGPAGLVHRRLKIIDLSDAANQPMLSEDGTVALVYNGECYNYMELRRELEAGGCRFRTRSDTEVVLALYERYGEEFPTRIRGMFALAVWDGRLRRLLLARDRLGIKPLCYSLAGGTLAFASELQTLLALPWISRDLNMQALGCYFRMYSIPDPQSALRDVHRLEPGHLLVADAAGVRTRRWWRLPVAALDIAPDEAAAELEQTLAEAVRLHLVADVPVGVALSGGLDSSILAALAAASADRGKPLHTFSLGVPEAEHDESAPAAAFAARLGNVHHAVTMPPLTPMLLRDFVQRADEPLAISSGLGLLALSRAAAEHGVKVLLSGDGGDELFAGYVWRHQAVLPPGDPAEAYAKKVCFNGDNTLGALLAPDFLAAAGDTWQHRLATLHREPESADDLSRRLYTDVHSTLVSEMLAKSDRMTMAHGVEGRVPYLDHRLVELAFSLPTSCKVHNGAGKAVLRRAAARLLPPDVLSRPKRGFNIPLDRALAGPLLPWTREVLADAGSRPFYLPGAVDRLYAGRLARGESFSLEDSHRLFATLALELWLRHCLGGQGTT